MNLTRVLLSSGNVFYHWKECDSNISHAYVCDSEEHIFLGAFLAEEADRKLKAFSALKGVIVSNIVGDFETFTENASKLSLQSFEDKLSTASRYFKNHFTKMVCDLSDCNGTSSKAESCDERAYYYKAVGMDKAYKSNKKFIMGFFIANHYAIFSGEKFKETFFKGYIEDPRKDLSMELKTRYASGSFKAPAAYVRALCNNL